MFLILTSVVMIEIGPTKTALFNTTLWYRVSLEFRHFTDLQNSFTLTLSRFGGLRQHWVRSTFAKTLV